jgi:thiamine-phosphate diphosphorylase
MLPRLHVVTDDEVLASPEFAGRAEAVLVAGGADVALHLRGHGTTAAVLESLGERLVAAALRSGGWLLVNDRIDVAMAVRANGVQLGAASLPVTDARALLGAGARIGYSAHDAEEALLAAADGADFVVMGTIYRSASHPDVAPAGVAALRACAARAGVPVIAIGGVTPAHVAETAAAGAHGVAVLGGVWSAADSALAVVAYRTELDAAHGSAARQEQGS